MPLKISKGNMYSWVDYMHGHLAGECPHKCSYCYVQRNKFGVSPRYKGQLRFIKEELRVVYGTNKTIFIEHMNDMFADGVPKDWIMDILLHCRRYPENTYVFQTKNPKNAFDFLNVFPPKTLIGTTIESNREYKLWTSAPTPLDRYLGMKLFTLRGFETFVTIEPIMDLDVDILAGWIVDLKPSFINIGADSKQTSLPEPSKEKILALVKALQEKKVNIRKKVNLTRIIG